MQCQCIYIRPGRDIDYWWLNFGLSCGIGTRARQRVSSSCENMCISYKCRVFHPDVYLEAMAVKMQNIYDRVTLHLLSIPPSLSGYAYTF